MKRFDFRRFRIRLRKPSSVELTDRLLLANLYVTQGLVFVIGILIIFFQSQNAIDLFKLPADTSAWLWACGFAAVVLAADFAVGRWVPEEVTDDGGINNLLFRNRPLWHIALLSFVVAVCEELLFRGAIQYAIGAYWTSILFAAIHVRYLRHWLMTGLVFSISWGLGLIYDTTGSLWTPITAHFLIDFVLGCMIKYRGRKKMSTGTNPTGRRENEKPEEEDRRLPPRRVLHAKDTSKAMKFYHVSLILMLILISASMVVLYQLYWR